MVGGMVMKKYFWPILSLLALGGAVACEKKTEAVDPVPEEVVEPVTGWKVSVRAGKGGDATKALTYDSETGKVLTSFKTTDKVYVYNKTQAALDAGTLSPDSDAASVKLEGTLTGSYAVGDALELRYGPYCPSGDGIFDYEEQDGTFETLRDFAVATVSVTAVDAVNHTLKLGEAHFTNPYSIFKFTFRDADTGDPIPIDRLWIKTIRGKLVFMDNPDGTREYYGEIADGRFPREVTRSNSTEPVWLSLCYEAPDTTPETDWLAFAILDNVNKIVYDMSKMTDGKIVNGKYYAPTIKMMPLPKPAVTLTGSVTPVEPTQIGTSLYELGFNNYYTYENPGLDITIGGESGDQCRFKWGGGSDATVRFKGRDQASPQFFVCTATPLLEHLQSGALTIDLDGDTQIIGSADCPAIKVDYIYGEVVFQGMGTLGIISSNTKGNRGIMTSDAAGNPHDGVLNVHAASGYVLDIALVHDNGDGTSTWTYTVSPSSMAPGSVSGMQNYTDGGNPFLP